MADIEKVIERARDLADRYGRPSDVQPGPIAGHVTVRWSADNSCGMIAVEFDAGLPAAEAVARLVVALREHEYVMSLPAGARFIAGWTATCRACGKQIHGMKEIHPDVWNRDYPTRYGCPGKKEGE